ncbi:unnamed protein product, partial [Ectocarpus sp. 8 AP-2014]
MLKAHTSWEQTNREEVRLLILRWNALFPIAATKRTDKYHSIRERPLRVAGPIRRRRQKTEKERKKGMEKMRKRLCEHFPPHREVYQSAAREVHYQTDTASGKLQQRATPHLP